MKHYSRTSYRLLFRVLSSRIQYADPDIDHQSDSFVFLLPLQLFQVIPIHGLDSRICRGLYIDQPIE